MRKGKDEKDFLHIIAFYFLVYLGPLGIAGI